MVGVQYKEALKLQVAARARASVDYTLFLKHTFHKFQQVLPVRVLRWISRWLIIQSKANSRALQLKVLEMA